MLFMISNSYLKIRYVKYRLAFPKLMLELKSKTWNLLPLFAQSSLSHVCRCFRFCWRWLSGCRFSRIVNSASTCFRSNQRTMLKIGLSVN